MGMYDYVNGEQVKCFSIPVYYGKNEIRECGIGTICGNLKHFKTGENVPYKSYHYDYGQDFMIFDEFPEFFKSEEKVNEELIKLIENMDNENHVCKSDENKLKFCMHVIKGGKVIGTFYDLKSLEPFFKNNKIVVGYYGEVLNIKSIKDICDFIKENKEFQNKKTLHFKEHNEYFKSLMESATGIGLLDKESEEYKQKLEMFNKYSKLIEESRNEAIKRFEPTSLAFYDKWYIEEEYELEKTFGIFLNVANYLSRALVAHPKDKHYKNRFEELSIEFKMFILNNNNIIEKYLLWNTDIDKNVIEDVLRKLK